MSIRCFTCFVCFLVRFFGGAGLVCGFVSFGFFFRWEVLCGGVCLYMLVFFSFLVWLFFVGCSCVVVFFLFFVFCVFFFFGVCGVVFGWCFVLGLLLF